MNWYQKNIQNNKEIISKQICLSSKKKKMIKMAYMSKDHQTNFNDTVANDPYHCKIALTESKKRIVLSIVFMNNIHSFPLFSEAWKYPKTESKRAIKTFNRCVNIVEDIKAESEDDDLPSPTLQGKARESLRYVDIDRKEAKPSISLEAAKYLDGESDWRSSLYGNRMPDQYEHPLRPFYPPTANIGEGQTYYNVLNYGKVEIKK